MNNQLSQIASELMALARRCALRDEVESELPNYGNGDADYAAANAIAVRAGFGCVDEVLGQIEQRTSSKWMHQSALNQFHSPDLYELHYGSNR